MKIGKERVGEMKYRHEWKHRITYEDMLELRSRLSVITSKDPYAKEGKYQVRSFYFDNIWDKALREKLDGVKNREKFRLRYYNCDTTLIRLEKKSKINGLCAKESALLSKEQAQALIDRDYDWMAVSGNSFLMECCQKMRSQGLYARTIVEYTREPFVFAPGNVRITMDSNIRTGLYSTDFWNPDGVTLAAGDDIILEVKWDAYLPDVIRDAIQIPGCRTEAFSKYAACRIWG